MTAPITYVPDFVENPTDKLWSLQEHLAWVRRGDTPRSEYYCNDHPEPYTYGRGAGRRTYAPQPWAPTVAKIRAAVEGLAGCKFEVCFLNRYLDQSDQLGWHADDSPEMDDARPIAVVSLGVERDIMFRSRSDQAVAERLRLGHGSLLLMAAGMQDFWLHRIPKASFQCGERVSLTFRGYVKQSKETT